MSNDHDNYRPRSPDLSSYRPQPPRLTSSYETNSAFPTGYNLTHRGSYDASPYFNPQTAQPFQSYFNQQPHTFNSQHQAYDTSQPQPFPSQKTQVHGPQSIGQLPLQHIPTNSFDHPPAAGFSSRAEENMPRRRKSDDEEDDDYNYTPEGTVSSTGGKGTRKRKSDNSGVTKVSRASGPGPSQGIEVKTKFPVARIKRIMQADEDVGKVAQATPTAVSKALELFMITLVTKAALQARDRSSKRVTAAHLKQAVLSDDNLDFLVEIVGKVPDPTEKKGRAKSEEAGDPSEESVKKKRTLGAGKKKKVEADDD